MRTDLTGSQVALPTDESLAHWNATITGFLAHGADTPVHLGKVLETAPDFALGLTTKGLFSVLLGRREMLATAAEMVTAARRVLRAGDSDRRTEHMLAALEAMLARQPRQAIAAVEQILLANPRDTLAMKLSHGIRFLIGDAAGMRRSVERVKTAHDADHPLRGYLLGCHAFALEETGDYAAAERTGMEGLTYTTNDAWGLHAVAHVHDMTGRSCDGIALIENNIGAWIESNNFRFHVWWHKALLHLDRGETEVVLALYDQKIRAEKTDDYRDIANATSLLARLELDGTDVGDRWDELADYSENRVEDGCLVFADLHYMLALIGGDRADAEARLTAHVAALAHADDGLAAIYDHPGRAVADGLAAFGEGRYDEAFARMESARPQLITIGGSHAQRDVFERMTIEAGLRAGKLDRTEALLLDRTALRAGKPDRFAETRHERISAARHLAHSVLAQ